MVRTHIHRLRDLSPINYEAQQIKIDTNTAPLYRRSHKFLRLVRLSVSGVGQASTPESMQAGDASTARERATNPTEIILSINGLQN